MSEEMLENKSSDSMLSDSNKELNDSNKKVSDLNKKMSDLTKEMNDLSKELDDRIKELNDLKICCFILLLDIGFIWYIYNNDIIVDKSKHLNLLQLIMLVNIMLFYLLKHLFRKLKFL